MGVAMCGDARNLGLQILSARRRKPMTVPSFVREIMNEVVLVLQFSVDGVTPSWGLLSMVLFTI